MDFDMRDVDMFVKKILANLDDKYRPAMHVLIVECIEKVGLNKKNIIEEINKYSSKDKIDEISSKSFCNKTYFKFYNNLDKETQKDILDNLIKIIENCSSKNDFLIIDKQDKLISVSSNINETSDVKKIYEDNEIGSIIVNEEYGTIECKKIVNKSENSINNFPYNFGIISEIEISDKDDINLKENVDNYIEFYMEDIKFVNSNIAKIEKFAVNEIWQWFIEEYTPESLKNEFNELSVDLTINLMSTKEKEVSMTALWSFESNDEDKSGYFDIFIDKENGEIFGRDIGYW